MSPCCGTQQERHDIDSVVGRTFAEVWEGAAWTGLRDRFLHGVPAADAAAAASGTSICDACPIPEDQDRWVRAFVPRFLGDAPRSVQRRAVQLCPELAPALPPAARWPQPASSLSGEDFYTVQVHCKLRNLSRPRIRGQQS